MKVGTKSLLFGVHQFIIHPLSLFCAWWALYGFPWNPRLWVAFIVHDLGYWGKPNMDGPEGESHPYLGAAIMAACFGREWGDFTLLHSRFLSRKLGRNFSRLCVADKLVLATTPRWVWIVQARLSGELKHYRCPDEGRNPVSDISDWEWITDLQRKMLVWVSDNHAKADPQPKYKWVLRLFGAAVAAENERYQQERADHQHNV